MVSIIWFNQSNCHPGSLPGRGLFSGLISTIPLVKNGSRPEACRDDIVFHAGWLEEKNCHPGSLLGRGPFSFIDELVSPSSYANNGFVLPNASIAAPVMAELASDARKTATSAISSGNMSFGLSGRPRVSNASRVRRSMRLGGRTFPVASNVAASGPSMRARFPA